MISEKTIDEIKQRIKLTDLAAEFTQLKRQGSRHSGLCPFHAEKSASFFINEDNFFHCFGCGASGNVFSFVMRAKGLSFPEAVEELAARCGVEIERSGGARRGATSSDREEMFKAARIAFKFFRQMLKSSEGKRCWEYMRQRGITPEALNAFGLGFAPLSRHALADHLRSQGLSEDLCIKCGLIRRDAKGIAGDIFRGRLIFPILLDRKRIAGFGGRILPEFAEEGGDYTPPKYLNSAESPIYKKSKVLFGFPQALQSIRQNKRIFIVEGYLDVIGMWQAGVKEVVATCGTAISAEHVSKISNLARTVVMLFDGDDAGRRAAGKSYQYFMNSGLDARCIFLPQGEDPDSFARKHESETNIALKELKESSLFEAYLRSLIVESGSDVSTLGAAAKGAISMQVSKVLREVKNPIERSELSSQAAGILRVEAAQLLALSDGQSSPRREHGEIASLQSAAAGSERAIDQLRPEDREILRAVMGLRAPVIMRILADSALASQLDSTVLRFVSALSEIYSDLGNAGESEDDIQAARKSACRQLLEHFGPTWIQFWKIANQMAASDAASLEQGLEESITQLNRRKLQQTLQSLDREIPLVGTEEERLRLRQVQLELRRKIHLQL